MNKFKYLSSCRVCKGYNLKPYLDLGNTPLSNNLPKYPFDKVEVYPLKVLFCEDCSLSQLSIVVDPKVLYTDYVYHSSVSQTFKDHCRQMAKQVKDQFKFKSDKPTCMDIACNDGALLREFKKEGFIVRGYEPCKELADEARGWDFKSTPPDNLGSTMIPVINEFFTEKSSNNQRSWIGEDVITATNVLGHVHDLDDFMKALVYQMEKNEDAIFIGEVPYLHTLISHCEFDTIYHEHLSYFLLKPLKILFERHNLPIFKVEYYDIHGGSIRIYASKPGREIDKSVNDMILFEETYEMYEFKTYADFAHQVFDLREDLIDTIQGIKKLDKSIVAYGASAKGVNLINHCGLGKYIDYVIDDTPAKQGKLIPGTSVQIHPFSKFDTDPPDYILLTAWNFKDELIKKTKYLGAKYIVPVPEVEVI